MKKLGFIIISIIFWGCSANQKITDKKVAITSQPSEINTALEIEFEKGAEHNHPSFAIWVEDLEGNYVETLFVTDYFAKGKFGHGEVQPGKWKNEPGEVRRPATLPYWSHKRNTKAADGLYAPSPETSVPDALSGATPTGDFLLETGSKITGGKKYRVLFEINQAWDANGFWTNNKFPDDANYKTSLQPALVYAATIDTGNPGSKVYLNPIGHSHHSGKTGELFTDLSTITTAKQIAKRISVQVK